MNDEKTQKRLARKYQKDEMMRIQKEESERKAAEWKASYPARVREYKELLKEANIEFSYSVDDDLNVSIKVNSGYEYITVDNERYYIDTTSMLSPSTEEWEYERMVESITEIKVARADFAVFFERVKSFKKSLTEEQLKMIKYFNLVI